MRHAKLALVALALAPATAFANATITIVNGNAPGVGFNDPTPAAPVGGNPGTTVGAQRLIAFQYAASIWGATLDSAAPIRIFATFEAQVCTPTQATLGSASNINFFRDFPGAPLPLHWYHGALASKLFGADLVTPSATELGSHIRARFNSLLNGDPACLGGIGWYYGLDAQHGANIDLVTVLLHEMGHGLGYSSFVSRSAATLGQFFPAGAAERFSDPFAHYLIDNQTNKSWEVMTDAERGTSMKNGRHLVWTGPAVTAAVPDELAPGTPLLRVTAPANIAGAYAVGAAVFGPQLNAAGVSGGIVAALDPADAAGPTVNDACSPITNGAAISGNIALVDRGTCGFIVKVKNAQNAGAVAVIVADNAAGSPPAALGGADPTIVIPSVRITLPDGQRIRAALAGGPVTGSLLSDLSVLAGADPQGRAMLYATDPVIAGSTINHWDTSAFPNLLMEPNINADLTHDLDLTLPEMRDVGWYPDADVDNVPDAADACPGSDLSDTVTIAGCNSGVTNWLFTNGCTVADLVDRCADGAGNHGGYVSCVSHTTNDLKKAGFISGADKGAIQSCAAGAPIP